MWDGSGGMYHVQRLWPGELFVCVGSGPSLTAADIGFCRGKARVVVVNDGYRLAPWADVLWACDGKWWEHHQGVPSFTGLKFSLDKKAERWPGVQALQRLGSHGLSLDPSGVTTGGNSGMQAIGAAVHLGASRIVLLGYDMQTAGKKTHWFGKHPPALERLSPYDSFMSAFATMVQPLKKAGIEVINCSRSTSLAAFPCRPLEEVLSQVAA